jgi:polar amino acid transport system permease protein
MISQMFEILNVYGVLLLVGQFPEGPLGRLALTLCMACAGLVGAIPLALLVGVIRTRPGTIAYYPISAFVHVIRGTPVLLLIFWAYFVVPLLIGEAVSAVTTVIVALIVYEAAFLAEVIRSGIEALPKGQMEASRAVGLNYMQSMRDVVLPQALFNVIPSIIGQFINLIKNTSLGYIISVSELTYTAYQVNSQLLTGTLPVFTLLAIIYFCICFSLSQAVTFAERKIERLRLAPHLSGASR